jgi:hypothetical protein
MGNNQTIDYNQVQTKQSSTINSSNMTLDEEVVRYLSDEKYRAIFSNNIRMFKQYIVTNNIQYNVVIRTIGKIIDTIVLPIVKTNHYTNLVQCLKDYLNANNYKYNQECISLIKAAYDPKTNKFHPIITKEFLEYVLKYRRSIRSNYIYYANNILQLLKYPNKRSSDDIYNEQILINIFKMAKLNPNMMIQNCEFLIREVTKCGYVDLLHLLLDKGILIYSDKLVEPSEIAPNKYLLFERHYDRYGFEYYWYLPSYGSCQSEKSHNYIVQYYKNKNNTEMVNKLEKIVPIRKDLGSDKKGAILKEMVVC